MSSRGGVAVSVVAPAMDRRPLRRGRIAVRFSLPYYTRWGQKLALAFLDTTLATAATATPLTSSRMLLMNPRHHGEVLFWEVELTVPAPETAPLVTEYSYCVVDDSPAMSILRQEGGAPRHLSLPRDLPDGMSINVLDLWQEKFHPESFLLKSAFTKAIFRRTDEDDGECNGASKELYKPSLDQFPSDDFDLQDFLVVRFKISCPRLKSGEVVHLTGGVSTLGNWELRKLVKLTLVVDGSYWQADVIVGRSEFPLRYKYVVKDKEGRVIPEIGSERELCLDETTRKRSALVICSDGYFKENPWRGAGLALPVFSMRSNDDVGVGEFLDLKLLVDLAVKFGMHLIQLLPINDTSVHKMWWDSYPYSSLSVFALHPLYLRVQDLSDSVPHPIKEEIKAAKKRLDLKHVDYDATMAAKLGIAKKIFLLEKDKVFSSSAYQIFFNENQEWLKPYAVFCFLRDFFETSDHSKWGVYSEYTAEKMEKLSSPSADHYNTIAFHYYVQYHLHLQLSEAASYARKNNVVLKGDLPIGVGRHSVDTWVYPSLFRMNTSTGAPPDYFDKNGQNWGFPTYNWEEMSKDNYGWWRARLSQMAKYFTSYRIDHVLGFFRIWEIPEHAVTGLMGKFRPSHPLTQEELESHGIWDFNRLSQPYVRRHLLQQRFGDEWEDVASTYFLEHEDFRFEFKPEYDTEKKIVAAAELRESLTQEVQRNLIELLQEVVLLRDPEDSRKFYPQFNLDKTASFNELDDYSKQVLLRLHHDYYFQRQEDLWHKNALKTLPALLNSSDMMACGEDLGMIPACVPPVLCELGLIGLRIQRMPSAPGKEFANPADYEYTTVCTPSCHDCSTLRAWWEEDEGRRKRFFRDLLNFSELPPARCEPRVTYAIIRQHMEAPSMWAVFPLQDILALKEDYMMRPAREETINDPTNPKHYWRYRVHVTLENLLSDTELSGIVREVIVKSGRSTPGASPLGDREMVTPPSVPAKNAHSHFMKVGIEKLEISDNGNAGQMGIVDGNGFIENGGI